MELFPTSSSNENSKHDDVSHWCSGGRTGWVNIAIVNIRRILTSSDAASAFAVDRTSSSTAVFLATFSSAIALIDSAGPQ